MLGIDIASVFFLHQLCQAEGIVLSNKKKFSNKPKGNLSSVGIMSYQWGLWQDKVSIMKPLTFMNNSGYSVTAYARYKNIAPSQTLVIHDEIDFHCGKVRFKFGGSEGGNNGLRSISSAYGSNDYWRLRIGIGRPAAKEDVVSYVLSSPPPAEKQVLYRDIVPTVIAAINEFVWGNKEFAMQKLHSTT